MLSEVFHTHFLHDFSWLQVFFSQNESSAWNLTKFTKKYLLKIKIVQLYTANVCSQVTSLLRLKRCSLSLSTANSSGLVFAVLHYNHTTAVLQLIAVARTIIGM